MSKTIVPGKKKKTYTTTELRLNFALKNDMTKNADIYVRITPCNTLIGMIHCSKIENQYHYVPLRLAYVQYTNQALKELAKVVESANNNLKT